MCACASFSRRALLPVHGHVAASDDCDQALWHKEADQIGGWLLVEWCRTSLAQVDPPQSANKSPAPELRGYRAQVRLIATMICRPFCDQNSLLAYANLTGCLNARAVPECRTVFLLFVVSVYNFALPRDSSVPFVSKSWHKDREELPSSILSSKSPRLLR